MYTMFSCAISRALNGVVAIVVMSISVAETIDKGHKLARFLTVESETRCHRKAAFCLKFILQLACSLVGDGFVGHALQCQEYVVGVGVKIVLTELVDIVFVQHSHRVNGKFVVVIFLFGE